MLDSESFSGRRKVIEFVGGYSKILVYYRAKRPQWLWRKTSPFGAPTTRLASEHGLTVMRGPFKGIRFSRDALGHANYLSSKLLGTYEPAVVEFLAAKSPSCDAFVDIGSGDGFFCLGAAATGARQVIGFETNKFERVLAAKNARQNECSIELRGFADSEAIAALPEGNLLLLVDIEGYEEDLLNPEVTPRLRQATMVVEIHEHIRPDVAAILTDRFSGTHTIARIGATPAGTNLSELDGWDEESAALAVHDGHSPNDGWMTFVPR